MATAQTPIRVLIVDDDLRVARALAGVLSAYGCLCKAVDSADAAVLAAERGHFDVIVADYWLGLTNGIELVRRLRKLGHALPCVLVTGAIESLPDADSALATAVLQKPFPAALLHDAVIRAAGAEPDIAVAHRSTEDATLVEIVQRLARARDRRDVVEIVRRYARTLVNADGATFVLRSGDQSCYVDEDAIGPLLKGRCFPMNTCLSGNCMLERKPLRVSDIYADPRVPAEAYMPTFVKSLVMVPIRTEDPIGAIGAYWSSEHQATDAEVGVLSALADTAAAALSTVGLIDELEQRLQERTQELAATNRDLELFASAAAHDLNGPLAAIYSNAETVLLCTGERMLPSDRVPIEEIRASAVEMSSILTNLLRLSKMSATELRRNPIDVTRMAEELAGELRAREPQRQVDWGIAPGLSAEGDPQLVRLALQNLLTNAWKYTARREHAHIEVGERATGRGKALFVRDDGVGFDAAQARQLFLPFRRLHDRREYPGKGIGLVTVARVAAKHGGQAWAEGEAGRGATFYLQLGRVDSPPDDESSAAAVRAG
jgi:signal transduction histidine kinase/FixJ family two-component response regulator